MNTTPIFSSSLLTAAIRATGQNCCDSADTLLHPSTGSGRTGVSDRSNAMSLLDESPAISLELGLRPLMERVLFRRETLKV